MDVGEVSQSEGDAAREPRVTKALRLAHSLGVSIDEMIERIYWNPGEIAPRPAERRPPSERLAGFFLVLPANVPVFEPVVPRDPVADRKEAAAILGQNLREARERRHLTQTSVARAAGLSKAGLSLIERGVPETTVKTLLALARALEVTPESLLGGIAWRPLCARPRRGGALGHPYRNRPTSAVHEGARQRRGPCLRQAPDSGVDRGVEKTDRLEIANADVAARIGANVALLRYERGLTREQLGEAIESDRTYVHQVEAGRKVPRLALIVKLAASLNVRCSRLTAGVHWRPSSQAFYLDDGATEPKAGIGRLGQNVREARQRIGVSQQALGVRAEVSRGDVVDFERGKRNFRIFTALRLAGALEADLSELLAGVADWYIRPLPAPEYARGDRRPAKADRDSLLVRLWREGKSECEIAEALDLASSAVGPYVRDLRDVGVDLRYRRPPRTPIEIAARRRRRHDARLPDSTPPGH